MEGDKELQPSPRNWGNTVTVTVTVSATERDGDLRTCRSFCSSHSFLRSVAIVLISAGSSQVR